LNASKLTDPRSQSRDQGHQIPTIKEKKISVKKKTQKKAIYKK
jgi:hypothetical protein